MAIAFVKTTTGTPTKAVSALTVNATCTVGNFLVAVVAWGASNAQVNGGVTGWTMNGGSGNSVFPNAPTASTQLYYKQAAATTESFAWTANGGFTGAVGIVILEFSGVASADVSNAPFNGAGTPYGSGSGTSTATFPSGSTATTATGLSGAGGSPAGRAVVMAVAVNAAVTISAVTAANGWTNSGVAATTTFGTTGGSAASNVTGLCFYILNAPTATTSFPTGTLSGAALQSSPDDYVMLIPSLAAATFAPLRRVGKRR